MGVGAFWAEDTAGKVKTPAGREGRNMGHWLTATGEDLALSETGEYS